MDTLPNLQTSNPPNFQNTKPPNSKLYTFYMFYTA